MKRLDLVIDLFINLLIDLEGGLELVSACLLIYISSQTSILSFLFFFFSSFVVAEKSSLVLSITGIGLRNES